MFVFSLAPFVTARYSLRSQTEKRAFDADGELSRFGLGRRLGVLGAASGRPFDIAIIGGGVNGCGIAQRRRRPRLVGVSLRKRRSRLLDFQRIQQADSRRPALSRTFRVSFGARSAHRAREFCGKSRLISSGRFASSCRITRVCAPPGCCASAFSSTTISAGVACCRRPERCDWPMTRRANRSSRSTNSGSNIRIAGPKTRGWWS